MKIFNWINKIPSGGDKQPMVSGHVNQSGGTFQFYLNRTYYSYGGTTVIVNVDENGYWEWNNEEGYNITSLAGMFYQNSLIIDVSFGKEFDTSNVTTMNSMFSNCNNLTSVYSSELNTSNVTNMIQIFSNCPKLTTVGDLSGWNTSNVTTMEYMFNICPKLTSISGLENWNTSKVTTMERMFHSCSKLTTLDLSKWNTSNVTDMKYMFYSCFGLTHLKLDNWITTQVTAYSSFADNESRLTIDYKPSQWNSAIPASFSKVNWNSVE